MILARLSKSSILLCLLTALLLPLLKAAVTSYHQPVSPLNQFNRADKEKLENSKAVLNDNDKLKNNNTNMAFFNFCQDFCKYVIEKTKDIEFNGISISSDLFVNVQNQSSIQKIDCNKLIAESTNLLETSLQNSLHIKKFGSKIDKEISDAINLSYQYLSLSDDDWELLGEEDNIKIWKCKQSLSTHSNNKHNKLAAKWPCIKSTTIIDASPTALKNLLMDSTKVLLVNKFSAGRQDVETIDEHSKIVWNKTRMPYSYKPYDFCTLMHCYKEPTQNKFMLISRAIDHPSVPLQKEYTRSEIYLGLNILTPVKNDARKTQMTTINHVRYGGIPAFLASRNTFQPTVGYFKHLKAIAKTLKHE